MNCASEDYVGKERIFVAIDDHDNDREFLPGAISSRYDSEEQNEIENNLF